MKSSMIGHSDKSRSQGLVWPAARRILIMALAVAPPFFATGCSKPATEVCNAFCECQGCTQSAYEDCLGKGESAVEEADKAGCSSQYDDYLSCVAEEAECPDGKKFTFDGCTLQQEALWKCSGTNPCEQAAQKLCNCGLGCSSDPPTECTVQQECQAKCQVAASCDDINFFGSAYANCVGSC